MSIECEICGKKPITGHNVSHSHRKTKRRWLPNLQSFRLEDGTKVKACTKCIKTTAKVKKIKKDLIKKVFFSYYFKTMTSSSSGRSLA